MGSAVNHAIAELSALIGAAPADAKTRAAWLDRLYQAYQDDEIPYLERLGDHWGALCGSREIASAWADRLIEQVRYTFSRAAGRGAYFKGTSNA